MQSINNRITNEICRATIAQLSDQYLINDYLQCNSVKNQISKLQTVLEQHLPNQEDTTQSIIQKYLLELIPAGTKGVIRGNKFNQIVKSYIIDLKLDPVQYDVQFEKKCEQYMTSEIPDWYILHRPSTKLIIGMNQLDLWGGGQQLNRGFKYLINNSNTDENIKLLCVVCNEIQFKSEKNKAYRLFEVGFRDNTLCYLNNLGNIIRGHFCD